MSEETATQPPGWLPPGQSRRQAGGPLLALVLVWSQEEPARVGELTTVSPEDEAVLGRGDGGPEKGAEKRLVFGSGRPGAHGGTPLGSRGLSRRQLHVRSHTSHLAVESIGHARMRVSRQLVSRVDLSPGDLLELEGVAVFLCAAREPLASGGMQPGFAYGEPDTSGILGEGARVWALRDELAMAARRPHHVLVTGPSGAGKELAARALHGLSARARGPWVARNAATLPSGLIDAELFGNARNYPNPGMPERPGLLGAADGGTLFLDEIGELPDDHQAHLLRVLDAGEYHRLGEDRARHADVRVVAATNRDRTALKHDLAARFKSTVAVPGLDERVEDIPLLSRFLLRSLAATDPTIAQRTFEGDEPRIAPDLMIGLIEHVWEGHVRELESLLLLALAHSKDHFVAMGPQVAARLRRRVRAGRQDLTREQVEQALEATGGNVSRAWPALGLPSRDALNRLIKKLGVTVR